MGSLRGNGVFATVLALVAVCAFSDEALAAGAGTAVAEEAEDANAAQETGPEGVQTAEADPEASDSDENASEGPESTSRPADTDV